MYHVRLLNKFKRDVRLCEKRGKDMRKFKEINELLVNGQSLPLHNRDHRLQGVWRGYRECHIEPDWLLIFRIEGNVLEYARMGSHSDLFR